VRVNDLAKLGHKRLMTQAARLRKSQGVHNEETPQRPDPQISEGQISAALSYWHRMRNVFAILGLGALATLGAGFQQLAAEAEAAQARRVSLAPQDQPVSELMAANGSVPFAEAAATHESLNKRGLNFSEGDDGLKLVPLGPEVPPKSAKVEIASLTPKAIPEDDSQPKLILPVLPRSSSARPIIAIVIDDVGLKPRASLQSVNLPAPMTIAFLPYGDNLQSLSDTAVRNGHEVIVHVPMQGKATADPGPNALTVDLSNAEIQKRLEWNLSRFTGYTGINNHMGSEFTENANGMGIVLEEIAKRKLIFLDSRTTSKSAARELAHTAQLPYAERDIFLDNHQDAGYVSVQLAQAEILARRNGSAIAIGHPHVVTLNAIALWSKTLSAKGIDLVPISAVIAQRGMANWRLATNRGKSKKSS
jgi:uncharacterized protein